ncbi:MAG: DUF1569 domain-containing protein [Phycisphaerales bacterium]
MSKTNTRTVERRPLRLDSFDALRLEIDRIERAVGSGSARTRGNWSVGQICQHVGKFLKCTMDGFETKAPWPVRALCTLCFKKKALGPDPMPSGFKLPKKAAFLLPDPDISDMEGIAYLRAQIERVLAGEQMTHPSPIFGPLTHEQWTTIQLKHAAMHLSFIEYEAHDHA